MIIIFGTYINNMKLMELLVLIHYYGKVRWEYTLSNLFQYLDGNSFYS